MDIIKHLEKEDDKPFDLILDLFCLPYWTWMRLAPFKGKAVEIIKCPAILGMGWAVRYVLIEKTNKERSWYVCQICPPENLKVGMTIKRGFAGKIFYQDYLKKVIIE